MVLGIFKRSPSANVSKSGKGVNSPYKVPQSASPSSDRICFSNTIEIKESLALPISSGPVAQALNEGIPEFDDEWKFAETEIDHTEELDDVVSVHHTEEHIDVVSRHHTQEHKDYTQNDEDKVLGIVSTAGEIGEIFSNSDDNRFENNTHEIEDISSAAPFLASNNDVASARTKEQCSRYGVIFGSVPTREEVEEAVSDINYSFCLSSLKHSGECLEAPEADSALAALESNQPNELEDLKEIDQRSIGSRDWIEPVLQLSCSSAFQYYGSNPVYHAFRLLLSDAQFKDMIISLASDKVLWDAVLSNQKVVEFRKRLEEVQSRQPVTSEEVVDEGCKQYWWDDLSEKLFQYFDKMKETVQKMFGYADKKVSGIHNRHVLISSSLMLSVVVLLVVLVKRR